MKPAKLGRNDPCWCGSGKKYKHCHLNQDEQAGRAAPPPPAVNLEPESEASALARNFSDGFAQSPEPQDQFAQAEWDRFQDADLDGKIAFFLQRLDEKRLDNEEVFEMLTAIRDASNPRHKPAARAQFRTLTERLEKEMPEVYFSEYAFLLECLLKDAIADQAWARVNDLAAQLTQIAVNKIDEFFEVVDALLYHGQMGVLFEEMKTAWNAVSKSPDIMPSGVQEFFEVLLDLNLFHYVESTPQPHADDPMLLESIRSIGDYNPIWLNLAVTHLAAPTPSLWQRADFGDGADAEIWEQNVAALLYEFMAERRRSAHVGNADSGVPYTRSNIARRLLHQILRQQWVETALTSRPKNKRAMLPAVTSPLIPQKELLNRILAGKFDLFGSEPYPVSALMELVPAYLHFLAHLGVIHPTELDAALDDLQPLIEPLFKVLDAYGADIHLLANLQTAWSDTALDELRSDPQLAQARTESLLIPAASSPLADALLYHFKITYRDDPDVWFGIELRREQTLTDLHHAIQDAADFDDDHLYSFYLSGTLWDKETEFSPRDARYSSHTALKNVPLRMKQRFVYLFDFGDQQLFDVQLIGVSRDVPNGHYPRLVEQHGKMPPQYGDAEEDEEWEDEDEE